MLVCLVVSGLAWGELVGRQWNEHRGWFWLDLGLGLAAYVLVFYRRRWPFAVAMALSVLGLVSMSSAGPALLAVVSLATRRRLAEILSVGAVGIIAGQLYVYYQPA